MIAGVGIRDLARACASVNWPTAAGTVTESRVIRYPNSRRTYSDDEVSSAAVAFQYEFKVGTVVFEGYRIAFDDSGSTVYPHARAFIARYPEGGDITVHYMPEDPATCLIEPGSRASLWALPGFGGLFFVVGGIGLVMLPRVMKQQ
ncbi:MAG: DUF3592 domain-containing protein [Planctomycetota bacterium]